MNIIDVSKVIEYSFKNGFTRAEVKVRDCKNRCHNIEFKKEFYVFEHVITIANILGDGHRVISLITR
ncbi:hypothetical protein TPELB_23660 [Terrisporobacter petrolearius]|uniref:Uncharacterized protein n=1 Tax=Terrisporobacter petrolearius TaxID=1460447 RepID=A0ABZ3FHD6_9FIRM